MLEGVVEDAAVGLLVADAGLTSRAPRSVAPARASCSSSGAAQTQLLMTPSRSPAAASASRRARRRGRRTRRASRKRPRVPEERLGQVSVKPSRAKQARSRAMRRCERVFLGRPRTGPRCSHAHPGRPEGRDSKSFAAPGCRTREDPSRRRPPTMDRARTRVSPTSRKTTSGWSRRGWSHGPSLGRTSARLAMSALAGLLALQPGRWRSRAGRAGCSARTLDPTRSRRGDRR